MLDRDHSVRFISLPRSNAERTFTSGCVCNRGNWKLGASEQPCSTVSYLSLRGSQPLRCDPHHGCGVTLIESSRSRVGDLSKWRSAASSRHLRKKSPYWFDAASCRRSAIIV